jgi:RNase P subunit RPR2
MPAVDAAGIAIGAVASILSSGDPADPRTRKDDRYINVKCRKCGEQFPIQT